MPTFLLKLEPTYYRQGFFNVPVAVDSAVRPDAGPVTLLPGGGTPISARVDRTSNRNHTARIHGGAALRDWFQTHFRQGDTVRVVFLSSDEIRLVPLRDGET